MMILRTTRKALGRPPRKRGEHDDGNGNQQQR